MIKKFSIPENSLFINAPKLNPEIKALDIEDAVIKRDARTVEKQERITAIMVGLTNLVSILLKLPVKEKVSSSKNITGPIRILSDLQYEKTSIRKSLIVKDIVTKLRDTLNLTSRSE